MSESVEGEITTSLDQPVLFNPQPILEEVDRFYDNALLSDNPALTILNKAKEILVGFRASGLALAKILYRLKLDWRRFGINEKFEDSVWAITGINKVTIDRYVTVWGIYEQNLVPEAVRPYMLSMQMRSQVPVAKTLSQGFALKDEDWQRIINAPDNASVRAELRLIKNQTMRKSGLMFRLKANGDLWATDSTGLQHYVGWLDIESTDETVIKMINRIVDNSYIIRE